MTTELSNTSSSGGAVSVASEVSRIHKMFFTDDNKESEWEERIKGLQAVQALVTNAQLVGSPQFSKRFEAVLIEDIDHQLQDPRSAVVKEACKTISDIATNVDYETARNFVLRMMPGLYAQLVKTKQIFRDSAHSCILSIIDHFPFNGICAKILEGLNDKHHLLREKCAEYLCKGVQKPTSANGLDAKLFESILATLKVRLGDSQPIVRDWSRKSLVALEAINPDRVAVFQTTLDLSLQKQLETAFSAKPASTGAAAASSDAQQAAAPAESSASATASVASQSSPSKAPLPRSPSKFREFLKAKAASGASPTKAPADEFFIDMDTK